MQFSVKNFNNSAVPENTVNFTGLTGKVSNLSAIKKFSKCHLDDIYFRLKDKLPPDFIQEQGENLLYKKTNSLADTLKYPFTKMPLEFLDKFANKFNIEGLQNSRLLTNFRDASENEKYERAMRGLLQTGGSYSVDNSKNMADEFYKLYDENLSKSKAHYNTPHERTVVKIVSSTTAAFIMGNDFYNKAILNNKTEDEAKKSAAGKRKQELIESGQEAVAQYITLGAFSEFTNNHTFAAPVLNTVLSTIFRITSRLSTGKSLTRIKIPEKQQATFKTLTMNSFINSIQNKKPITFEEIKPKNQPQNENNNKTPAKTHLLTLKNIGLACLASIAGGYILKGAGSTKGIRTIKETIQNSKAAKAIKDGAVGEVWVTDEEMGNFIKSLRNAKHKNMTAYYYKKVSELMKNPDRYKDGKILIGEYEKTLKIPFTKIEASKKEVMQIPLIPFKIVFEFVSYPYKAAQKIFEGIFGSKKVTKAIENIGNNKTKKNVEKIAKFFSKKPDKFELKNDCNLTNTYIDFQEQLQKNGGKINGNFIKSYQKHIDDNWILALNKETQSSVNNAAIGKLTSLLGTFASIYFATTDDFNETIKQTGNKEKAGKDARLRGVNKIIRMTTQIAFMDILNGAFKIPYAKSILGAGIITAACTILTDSVSRILSGMPFVKMDKEQLEKYNKNKKEGCLNGYYNVIDKLTD